MPPDKSTPPAGRRPVDVNDAHTDDISNPRQHQAQHADMVKDEHDSQEVLDQEPCDTADPDPKLPFSKARCIALVATLTGASFMNVSCFSLFPCFPDLHFCRALLSARDVSLLTYRQTVSIQSVVIILPALGADLDIPEQRYQWVISAHALAFGCFLLLWGRIADIYGKRIIFIAGSAWVSVVTIANAFIPNEIAFDLFRGLNGLGAAANVPTALGILGTTFPPGRAKNYAFSTYAAGAPLGSIFGNLIAGFIADFAHWRWVFGVKAILSAIITAAAIFVIPPTPKPSPSSSPNPSVAATHSVDWIGGFLITAGVFALLYALAEGNVVGWHRPWIPVIIVVSVLIIAAFVLWQHHLERKARAPPLMKVSMFRNARFSAAMFIMALFFGSFNNFLVFATYFWQDFQGHSPLQTTLRFLPTGIMGVVTAFVVALLISRVPTYLLLVFGNLSMAIACLLFAAPIPPSTSYFAYGLPAMVLSVFGADTTWPCLTLFTSKSLPPEDQALGGALINTVGQVGRAIGLAIATAVQTAVMARERDVPVQDVGSVETWDGPSLAGLRAGNWSNFGFAVCALLIVLLVFRSSEVVGRSDDKPDRSEEANMNEVSEPKTN